MIATRVMKARKASLCGYCGGPVSVGTRIALVGGVWMHLRPCALWLADPFTPLPVLTGTGG